MPDSPAPQTRPVEQEIAAVLAEHSPPAEVLSSLGDAWATCQCGARCDLKVSDGKVSIRELADWWRAHAAAALAPLIARERAAAAQEALRETADAWQTGAWADAPRRADRVQERLANAQHVTDWLRDRADRIGGDPT